jgi:hypothetical protein
MRDGPLSSKSSAAEEGAPPAAAGKQWCCRTNLAAAISPPRIITIESYVQRRVGTFERHSLFCAPTIVERQKSAESPALSDRFQDLSPCSNAVKGLAYPLAGYTPLPDTILAYTPRRG